MPKSASRRMSGLGTARASDGRIITAVPLIAAPALSTGPSLATLPSGEPLSSTEAKSSGVGASIAQNALTNADSFQGLINRFTGGPDPSLGIAGEKSFHDVPEGGGFLSSGVEGGGGAIASAATGALKKKGLLGSLGGASGLGVAIFCWAAAVYFERESRSWRDARLWITDGWPSESPVGKSFKKWYAKNGEALAKELKTDHTLYEAWRPFFQWARQRGMAYRLANELSSGKVA